MAGRILSLQRQARELGRLRSGYTDTSGAKPRPVKSTTWVITSHAEHYVASAADAWGGTAEKWQPLGGGAAQWRVITDTPALDAILPPGDPLSQSFELWSGGGCARRCDGFTETLSDKPCLCRAEHGDDFHTQPKGRVCAATTRLNVFLPELPDIGVWRVETHSFYAAQEIAGAVDIIRSAVGPDAVIPIRLRIEQRTRKAEGKTKQFPVVVVELRGITTGQVLGAKVMGGQELAAQAQRTALNGASPQPASGAAAITAGPAQQAAAANGKAAMSADEEQMILAQIGDVATIEDLREMWRDVVNAFLVPSGSPVLTALQRRAAELGSSVASAAPPAEQPGADVNPDDLWAQIMRTVPEDWSTSRVEKDFTDVTGVDPEQATGPQMYAYLQHLASQS